ncbi:MAG: hypothetical protein HDQ93_05635 [Desulfovibrio sp.]|nr:hypothetical protein [Desulfovibrio sp.]
MRRVIYELSDGRRWDTAAVRFLGSGEPNPDNSTVTPLISGEGLSDEAYLIRTLTFYNYPKGSLADTKPA